MDPLSATLRGLTIGHGTIYGWSGMPSGIFGTAEQRPEDEEIPRRSGLIPGDDLLGGKALVFPVTVYDRAGDGSFREPEVIALETAFAPGDTDEWIDVRISADEYTFLGRPRGVSIEASRRDYDAGVGRAVCRFLATDPLRYSRLASTLLLTIAPAGGGFSLPVTLPTVIGSAPGTSLGVAQNTGNTAVNWTGTLTGPLTNPRLEHVDSGLFVRIAGTLADGQILDLDSASGAILLNGTSPRPSWFAAGSRWWALAKDSNTIRFSADGGTGTALIEWRSGSK